MEDHIVDTWDTREMPILQAVYLAREAGADDLNKPAHAAVPDLDDRLFNQTIHNLFTDGTLDASIIGAWGGIARVRIKGLTPKGLRAVGAWPSGTAAEEFLRILSQRAEAESDPALSRFAEAGATVGTAVVAGLISHALARVGL